jgi:hypothetical protein
MMTRGRKRLTEVPVVLISITLKGFQCYNVMETFHYVVLNTEKKVVPYITSPFA